MAHSIFLHFHIVGIVHQFVLFFGECAIALCIDIRWSFWYLHLLSILLSYILSIYPDLFPMCNCLFEPSYVYLFVFSCFMLCVNIHCVPSSNTSIHQMLWWLKIIIRIWGIKSHVIYSNKWCRCLYLYWSTVVKFWLLLEIRNFNTKI